MRTGIEKSRNLDCRLANRIGMDNILSMASKFNINEGLDENFQCHLVLE